jgi:hypothetical protein
VTRVIFENIESIDEIINNLNGKDKIEINKDDEVKNIPLIIDDKENIQMKEFVVSPIVIQQENNKSDVDDTNENVQKEEITNNKSNTQLNNKTPLQPFDDMVNDLKNNNKSNTQFDMKKPQKSFDNMFNDLKSNNECFLDELFNTPIVVK